MHGLARYLRLLGAFARFGLATELSFRANFLVKLFVEVLWLGILLVFYRTLYDKTGLIAGWDRNQYLFFVGCHYALAGFIETFFLENCSGFPELIRSGNLDLYLLKPIDEQFLVSTRHIDWSTAPNMLLGVGVMVLALRDLNWAFDLMSLSVFLLLFACGLAMAYSFLLLLTSASVWFVRNQSLMEMWWLFTTLMRYPRGIYTGTLGTPFGLFFTFIVPVILVVNVPAYRMVKAVQLESGLAIYMVVAAVGLLVLSRWFFRYALRSYRSASS
jgi:ABC-2 type transport system permease protein